MNYNAAMEKLKKYGQEHVLKYYDELPDEQRNTLIEQIDRTDFTVIGQAAETGKRGTIAPIKAMTIPEIDMGRERFERSFFGQPFRVLKVDRTLVDYYTRLSDFHAQFRAVGTNYNQVVKELRLHFSEKKAMALLYKLEQQTVELVKLSRQIVELSREMEAKWSQKSV